jgi:hypothetical protein
MASLETVSQKLKEVKGAVKLARSVSDFACKANADKETQDFLWNKYQAILKIQGELEYILEEICSATIDIERVAEWRSVGLYKPHIFQTLKISRPGWSQRALTLLYQEFIDKASEDCYAAEKKLAGILTRAQTYLSA